VCSTAERIALRQVNEATGNRLRQQLIDQKTREPVAPEHKGRGYEVAKGQYLIVEDAELDAIEIESTHTIEIDRFVPRAQIDQRFFDTPYYVTPSEPVGQEAFAVIREAMRGKGMVALGRLVLSKRERVIAPRGCSAPRCATPMRCARLRITSATCRSLPLRRTCSRWPSLSSTARPASLTPRSFGTAYEEALLAHLKAKQAGTVPERKPAFAAPQRVVNLMEALRRSVAADAQGAAPRKGAVPARKRA
jgi:DNA end-binding protein Ku